MPNLVEPSQLLSIQMLGLDLLIDLITSVHHFNKKNETVYLSLKRISVF